MSVSQDGKFKKKTPFASVSIIALRDKTLSAQAKGLYAIIQSYITLEDFTLYKSFLLEQSTNGLRSFNTMWNELKEKGYLKQYRIRTEKGFRYEYELLDEPNTETPATFNVRMDGTISESYDENQSTFDDLGNQEISEKKDINRICLDIEVEDADDNEITDTEINIATQKIKKQIDYEKHKLEDDPQIDNLLNLMVEIETTKSTSINVGKEKLSTADMRKQYSKIDSLCINDILNSLKTYDKAIKNPRAFLLKMLYNAPKTAYTRKFNQDNLTTDSKKTKPK